MSPEPNEFWAELDRLGYDGVRVKLASKAYAGRRRSLAEEWIRKADQSAASELEARKLSSSLESNHTTRSEKNAAWAAAIAAIVAAIAAIVSGVIGFFRG